MGQDLSAEEQHFLNFKWAPAAGHPEVAGPASSRAGPRDVPLEPSGGTPW